MGRTYDAEPSRIALKDNLLSMSYGADVNKNANYFVGKTSLVATVFNYMDKVEKVVIEEEYTKPKDVKAETHVHDSAKEEE